MHGRKGRKLTKFEEVLEQYEPMISASIRKLNIYRDYESFKQVGRVALWQAWLRYDSNKGNFTPYAYRSIQGAMMDELKKENRVETHTTQMEDEILERYAEETVPMDEAWSNRLELAFEQLSVEERALINLLYVERRTQAESAKLAGISVAGIKKRRERMIGKLREILS